MQFDGINYGDIRDFWFSSGANKLFAHDALVNAKAAAAPLLDVLMINNGKKHIWPNAWKIVKGIEPIMYLMKNYFYTMNIKANTKNLFRDSQAKAAFSQVFLEYFMYYVYPRWCKLERILSDLITNVGAAGDSWGDVLNKGLGKVAKGASLLAYHMRWKVFANYLHEHLRFPNMTINLMDYPDVERRGDDEGKKKLDEYREKMGLPTLDKKTSVLKMIRGLWNKISEMSDGALQLNIKSIRP